MLIRELIPAGLAVERIMPIALGVLFIGLVIREVKSYRRLSHFPAASWICHFSSFWEYQVEMSGRNYHYWEKACEKHGQVAFFPLVEQV
jgi:hypothetical protein